MEGRQTKQKTRLESRSKKGQQKPKINKEEQICSLAEIVIKGSEVNIVEKMKIARKKDKEVVRVVEEIKKIGRRQECQTQFTPCYLRSRGGISKVQN